MIRKFLILTFFATVLSYVCFSQEVEFELTTNHVIKEYLKNHPTSNSNRRPQSSVLVSLPFRDDFSKPVGIYPDPTLWRDSNVFINSNYPDNPPTVGVATFDAIDKYGNPHEPGVIIRDNCDTLTSQMIDLSGLSQSDSVYFSFYYQPQGLGLQPYTDDSLVFEFRDSTQKEDTVWNWIWSAPGGSDVPFQRVNFKITDGKYFFAGFQFRFYNYAYPNANHSHWNLDYVYLDKNRTFNDDLNDIGFINSPNSVLNTYQSMPWEDYKNYGNKTALIKPAMTDSARCIHAQTTLTDTLNIYDETGISFYTFPHQGVGVGQDSTATFTSTLNGLLNPFPVNSLDSASFLIRENIHSVNDSYHDNDTVFYHQNFYNYYAYDDGSAESAYGVTPRNSAFACRFDLDLDNGNHDTLRGLQIYFNPTGYPVYTETFQICYWDQMSLSGAHLAMKTTNQVPANNDSINGFVNYYFDSAVAVNSPIYVGIIQDSDDPIGVGVDRNDKNTNGKVFYEISNVWYNSSLQGALMMRPIMGKDVRTGIEEQAYSIPSVDVFPNPASRSIFVTVNSANNNSFKTEIKNTLGQLMLSKSLSANSNHSSFLDVSTFADGVYFVQVTDEKTSAMATRKLVIQH